MEYKKIKKAKRIVIKIGASVLTAKGLKLDERWMRNLSSQIAALLKGKRQVVIVSSGAIAAGMGLLGMKKRPKNLPEQQACAALGQGYLMKTYEECFKKKGFHAAQILLTWEDIREKRRYFNAENTLRTLLSKNVVPVINENDTVSVDEIKFGDNDKLSALVASLISADLLIMLTDVEGLYIDDKKTVAGVIKDIHAGLEKIACGTGKECSTGGMKTKLDAAKIAVKSGIDCVIANGREKNVLLKIVNGEKVGTLFQASRKKITGRDFYDSAINRVIL
jgi:glutamate 5-kinase